MGHINNQYKIHYLQPLLYEKLVSCWNGKISNTCNLLDYFLVKKQNKMCEYLIENGFILDEESIRKLIYFICEHNFYNLSWIPMDLCNIL